MGEVNHDQGSEICDGGGWDEGVQERQEVKRSGVSVEAQLIIVVHERSVIDWIRGSNEIRCESHAMLRVLRAVHMD